MSNPGQSFSIPILCDVHDANQLKNILRSANNNITLDIQKDEEIVTRSAFNDPIVLAALIGAGATTLGAVITLIGVVWSARIKEKKANEDTGIVIKVSNQALQTILQKHPDKRTQLQELLDNSPTPDAIELSPEVAAAIEEGGNPYHLILNDLLPEEVKHIAILEED